MSRPNLKGYDEELIKNLEFKAAYETLGPFFELRGKLLEMRFNAGLSQEEMAERMGCL